MRYAVLSGDFVDSSEMPPAALDRAMTELRAAAEAMSGWDGAVIFARRGGDGWQIALPRPVLWLRAALFLRARLRRAAAGTTRIAIATGSGRIPDSADLNAAHGAVFTASGRLLETLSPPLLMGHADGGAAAAAAVLADQISQGWTQAQARTLCLLLPPGAPTHSEAAETLGVSRQAVDQSARAAALPALAEAIARIEAAA